MDQFYAFKSHLCCKLLNEKERETTHDRDWMHNASEFSLLLNSSTTQHFTICIGLILYIETIILIESKYTRPTQLSYIPFSHSLFKMPHHTRRRNMLWKTPKCSVSNQLQLFKWKEHLQSNSTDSSPINYPTGRRKQLQLNSITKLSNFRRNHVKPKRFSNCLNHLHAKEERHDLKQCNNSWKREAKRQ